MGVKLAVDRPRQWLLATIYVTLYRLNRESAGFRFSLVGATRYVCLFPGYGRSMGVHSTFKYQEFSFAIPACFFPPKKVVVCLNCKRRIQDYAEWYTERSGRISASHSWGNIDKHQLYLPTEIYPAVYDLVYRYTGMLYV